MNNFSKILFRFFSILLLPVCNHCFAQTTVYQFVVKDEKNNLVKDLLITLNGESVKTNSSGRIILPFRADAHQVSVELNEVAKYSIVSPANGLLNLPLNPNDITSIMVADKRVIVNQNLANKIVSLQQKLEKLSKENASERNQIQKQLDYLVKEGKKNNLSKSQLRTARELLDGRDSTFPLVSATLNSYVSRAKDVHDAFETMAGYALENPQAFEAMKKTVISYNEVYENWNTQKSNFEKSINDYWQSKELALKYQNLADYALNEVHRTYILQLNSLLEKINAYAIEKNNKKRRELKEHIISSIKEELPGLDSRNQVLGEKINSLLQILNTDPL